MSFSLPEPGALTRPCPLLRQERRPQECELYVICYNSGREIITTLIQYLCKILCNIRHHKFNIFVGYYIIYRFIREISQHWATLVQYFCDIEQHIYNMYMKCQTILNNIKYNIYVLNYTISNNIDKIFICEIIQY